VLPSPQNPKQMLQILVVKQRINSDVSPKHWSVTVNEVEKIEIKKQEVLPKHISGDVNTHWT
jgi:hypothetical protein